MHGGESLQLRQNNMGQIFHLRGGLPMQHPCATPTKDARATRAPSGRCLTAQGASLLEKNPFGLRSPLLDVIHFQFQRGIWRGRRHDAHKNTRLVRGSGPTVLATLEERSLHTAPAPRLATQAPQCSSMGRGIP